MYLKRLLTFSFLLILVGCAGVNFKKLEENRLVLGQTSKSEVLSVMGQPNVKGSNTFNGIELDIVGYSYASVGAQAALPGVTAARSQGLLFKDGILVGKEYTSSFAEDSTLFDTNKAKTISKGQSKAEVISIMGASRGEYLYPIIEDKNGYALIYMFAQTKGFKSKTDLFIVEFNKNNIVTKTKLSSAGML